MNLISVAAPLIRRAAAEEDHAHKLFEAFESERHEPESHESERDGQVLSRLVENPAVREDDLAELTPAEWQWYASWRQALGGQLDPLVLNYLTDSASTRFARYEVRALVLRDPQTNDDASRWALGAVPFGVVTGLEWLREQAQGARVKKEHDAQLDRNVEVVKALAAAREQYPNEEWIARVEEPFELWPALIEEALELARDAVQCATEASRFLLTELSLLKDERAELIGAYFDARQNQHVTSSEITARWYESNSETLGG